MVGFTDVSDKAKAFFYYLGQAITEWGKIDELLFETFARALNTDRQFAAIIYYRTNTMGGRLVLANEIIYSMFPKRKSGDHPSKTQESWTAIYKKIDNLLETRNQLAHSPTAPQAEFAPNPIDPNKPPIITDVWWASYITATEKLRGKSSTKKDLKIDDVKDHLQALGELWIELRDFNGVPLSVLQREFSQPKSRSP